MTPEAFRASVADPMPPPGLSPALLALWHVARDEWDRAHEVVQAHEGVADCDWVHAHLHRIEGDGANAGYWYRRARRPAASGPLVQEREAILATLLAAASTASAAPTGACGRSQLRKTGSRLGMGRLAGARALVTGAATDGMGRAIALGFAREGADIALHHRAEPDMAAAVVAEIAAMGRRARAFAADFSDVAATRAMVRDAAVWLGGLDILLSAAGTITRTPFLELTDAEVQQVVAVNLIGTFACAQEAARLMASAGRGGRLIAITSINQQKGMPLQSHYAATKGGVLQLFRSMALELGPLGITCNLIAPGAVVTDLNRHIMADDAHRARVAATIPLGRVGLPQDVVGAAIFLASTESAWMTGTTLHVDGGRSAV